MSKKSEAFIDKYVVGDNDWLLKHKEVIAKLLDEYETEQCNIANVVGRSEQLVSFLRQYQKTCEMMHMNKIDAKDFVELYKTN